MLLKASHDIEVEQIKAAILKELAISEFPN